VHFILNERHGQVVRIRDIKSVHLGSKIGYPHWDFSWYSSVSPEKSWVSQVL